MRYGIFSEVHANWEAFEAVIKAYSREQIDKFVCLGDTIGYGPEPHRCLRKLSDLDAVLIAGNHDWGAIDLLDISFFNHFAKNALLWSKPKLNKEDINLLRSMKLIYSCADFCCVHGSYVNPEGFPYIYSEIEVENAFKANPHAICFIGHTHIPVIYTLTLNKLLRSQADNIVIKNGNKYVFNVGSVGQPRDGSPMASYCVFDTKKKLVEIKRIRYNISKVQNKIRKAGLADFLAARLSQGR